ncbi:MAG: hypothetical protein H0V24_15870 [Chloroflexia bacterium]|nr:hypothetical protein [Chloroflexia bacterium]
MILGQLASARGERHHAANRRAPFACARDLSLLAEIGRGLDADDAALAGDCADVMNTVARWDPALVAPFGEQLDPLLSHRSNRVRWEAMQAVASIAPNRPDLIEPLLPRLQATIVTDTSVIARDAAVTAIANFAGSSPAAARTAVPLLTGVLELENGRFASRALTGPRQAGEVDPALAGALMPIAGSHLDHHRKVARDAAKQLLRAIEKAERLPQ